MGGYVRRWVLGDGLVFAGELKVSVPDFSIREKMNIWFTLLLAALVAMLTVFFVVK